MGRRKNDTLAACMLSVISLFPVCITGCASSVVQFNLPGWADGMLVWNATESEFAKELARARGLEREGQLNDARQIYHTLVSQNPESAEPHHRLGVVADKRRQHAEAERHYRKALELAPDNVAILNDLGYCLYLQGNLEKAAETLTRAAALDPHNLRIHNNLGLTYGQLGRLDIAFEEFGKAGSLADAHFNVAFVLASQGKFAEAKAAFHQALAAHPRHERARQALDSFLEYERDPEGFDETDMLFKNGIRYVPYDEKTGGPADPLAQNMPPAAASFGHKAVLSGEQAAKP